MIAVRTSAESIICAMRTIVTGRYNVGGVWPIRVWQLRLRCSVWVIKCVIEQRRSDFRKEHSCRLREARQ